MFEKVGVMQLRYWRSFTALGILTLFAFPAQPYAQDAQVSATGPAIRLALDDLDNIRDLVEKLNLAPEDGGVFKNGKSDFQDDINDYLDQIIRSILGDIYPNFRDELLQVDQKIDELEVQRDELELEKVNAPTSDEIIGSIDKLMQREFAKGSKESIAADIESQNAKISSLKANRQAIVHDFKNILRNEFGIDLPTRQVESLLYQVNGSSIIETSMIYRVLQTINDRLAKVRSETSNDEILRRYYGVAAVMRLMTVRMHQQHLQQYTEIWIPAIDELSRDNDDLIGKTQDFLENSDSQSRRLGYESNLNVQLKVEEAISDYRQLLIDRKVTTEKRLTDAVSDANLAINTLETLDQAALLFDQFSNQAEEYNSLISIENDTLIPLDDEEMQQNYLDISRQLAAS